MYYSGSGISDFYVDNNLVSVLCGFVERTYSTGRQSALRPEHVLLPYLPIIIICFFYFEILITNFIFILCSFAECGVDIPSCHVVRISM